MQAQYTSNKPLQLHLNDVFMLRPMFHAPYYLAASTNIFVFPLPVGAI